MNGTYFESLPSDILYVILNNFFGDTDIYSLIYFWNLNESVACRFLCIKAAPMLLRFSRDFSFKHRRISWLHIYENLVSIVRLNTGRLLDFPLFDEHFIFNEKCLIKCSYRPRILTPHLNNADLKILIIYEYNRLCVHDVIEKDDILFIYEKNLCELLDIKDLRSNIQDLYFRDLQLYKDIIVKCHNNYKKRLSFYTSSYEAIKDKSFLTIIETPNIYYDKRTNYILKSDNKWQSITVKGLMVNGTIQNLNEIEKIVAMSLGYFI